MFFNMSSGEKNAVKCGPLDRVCDEYLIVVRDIVSPGGSRAQNAVASSIAVFESGKNGRVSWNFLRKWRLIFRCSIR